MKNTDGKRNWENWFKTRRCFQPNKILEGSKEDGHGMCGHLHPWETSYQKDG